MKIYNGHWSKGGKSSIYKTSTGSNVIRIYFWDKAGGKLKYYYSKNTIGSSAFNTMKNLRDAHRGLNSYIVKNRLPYKVIKSW